MQLAMAHIDAHHPVCTALQQAMRKPPGGLAHIQALKILHRQPDVPQCGFELEPATRDKPRLGLGLLQQAHLGSGRNLVAIFDHAVPGCGRSQAPLHPAGDQALGLRAGTGQPALHQKDISTHNILRKIRLNRLRSKRLQLLHQ